MLVHTYADLQAVPPKRMWQLIRTLRQQPPGQAGKGHRRDTFNAAVEQAEQLFAAAAGTGTATRPILIFYGLSQLGRAIAAASNELGNDEYRLSGHGVRDGHLEGAASGGLANLRVQGCSTGAFPVVARALGADSLQVERRLGDVWGLIPDADRFPLPGAGSLFSLPLHLESPHIARSMTRARCIVASIPFSVLHDEDEPAVSGPGLALAQLIEESCSAHRGIR